ncbi:MAG: hypothetical protein CVV12_03555 [Gammaproteobacteria bacterium HGW-Gammaproteobacteria-2]|jgi:hypothetical protein|nr:MAG: hypothetical protein CVV12_03555 [Gammaproteobacteria bacterium HGW-Gammaproteobacteria-2]
MIQTRLFLDCEWADNLGSELVSIALVSADGAQRFYAELNPLPKQATDFARYVVYPLLDHGYWAMPCAELTRHLRRFVAPLPNPLVLYDHHNDGALFRYAMDGFEEADADALGPYPEVAQQLLSHDALKAQIERYFSEHPAARARRHHAMTDAEALRWAYSAANAEGLV